MSRSPLIVLCALLCASLALASAAVATPVAKRTTERTCHASSARVAGGEVTAKLVASDVDPSQARFATCAHAKRVIGRVTEIGLERPRGNVAGFYCKPSVLKTGPDYVVYVCTFKGADTATFVKLAFGVQYKS
jgi:hypothetical protein